jgi:hypothetical protein
MPRKDPEVVFVEIQDVEDHEIRTELACIVCVKGLTGGKHDAERSVGAQQAANLHDAL